MKPGKSLKDSIVFDVRAEIGSIRFLRFVGASPSYVRGGIYFGYHISILNVPGCVSYRHPV